MEQEMPDRVSEEQRSWNMSRIRSRDTKPEITVRALLHEMGYRFTVNGPKNRTLPGKPDIVLPKYQAVVFVHGCFWHRHEECKYAYIPKSRVEFWKKKFADNVERDRRVEGEIADLGWNQITVWECECRDMSELRKRIARALSL